MKIKMEMSLLLAATLMLSSGAVSAQSAPNLPEGLSLAMLSTGETLFKSIGLCFACHGMDGKGLPGIGSNLTDDEWLHNDGTFDNLVSQILDGVSPQVSSSGAMMPPKGGSAITEEQARAIAGYVWALSTRSQRVR